MEFVHRSVLLWECIDALNIKPDGIYLDGTLGGAGHSSQIAQRLTTGRLIGVDRDTVALEAAKLVFDNVETAYRDGNDCAAREAMLLAAIPWRIPSIAIPEALRKIRSATPGQREHKHRNAPAPAGPNPTPLQRKQPVQVFIRSPMQNRRLSRKARQKQRLRLPQHR